MARRPSKRARSSKKKPVKQTGDLLKGTLRIHPRGFGFVVPDDPSASDKDVFIPRNMIGDGVDGDHVEVEINPDSDWEKGPDGKILSIVERKRTQLAGLITETSPEVCAHVPILGPEKPILVKLSKNEKVHQGDRYLFTVTEWGDQKTTTVAKLGEKIGHIDDPSCDVRGGIAEYDLPSTFPKEVVEEAKTFGDKVEKKQLKGRLDLTKTTTFTIDPETAKDFDDALSISKDKKGNFSLGVHIADAAYYVRPGTALDKEAALRSNSTYFPGTCIPMLPEELSNNLCSLRDGVIRLTVSVLMEFSSDGSLLSSEIHRAFIKSKKRFSYGDAMEVLDGKKKSPHKKALQQMVELCHLLKAKRSARGSIDFALPELVLTIDKDGVPTGTKIEEYDITHQLVEEFMLKANETVAKSLSDRGEELLFRIHEEPTSENMEDFYATARTLGFTLPKKPTQEDVQAMFEQAKTTPFSQQLAIGFIRTLKIACYSPRNVGHYGLALEHYTHFTSPIRRYSDLVIQRILFSEEQNGQKLDQIASRCSERERVSFRAEMAVKSLKKLRLLQIWNEENPDRDFTARITQIKPFGFAFELKELFLEGFIHVSQLQEDYFHFDPKVPMLQGERTGKRYRVGDEVLVFPTMIDLIYLETAWELEVPKKQKRKSSK